MNRPDRRWRPSDADRERYAGAISQAFAEGRIDAADMEHRTEQVYRATSIADLDILVQDMPAPAPAPGTQAAAVADLTRQHTLTKSAGIGLGPVLVAVAVVVVVMLAVLGSITSGFTSADSRSRPHRHRRDHPLDRPGVGGRALGHRPAGTGPLRLPRRLRVAEQPRPGRRR